VICSMVPVTFVEARPRGWERQRRCQMRKFCSIFHSIFHSTFRSIFQRSDQTGIGLNTACSHRLYPRIHQVLHHIGPVASIKNLLCHPHYFGLFRSSPLASSISSSRCSSSSLLLSSTFMSQTTVLKGHRSLHLERRTVMDHACSPSNVVYTL
jgi:hypothetical protein